MDDRLDKLNVNEADLFKETVGYSVRQRRDGDLEGPAVAPKKKKRGPPRSSVDGQEGRLGLAAGRVRRPSPLRRCRRVQPGRASREEGSGARNRPESYLRMAADILFLHIKDGFNTV